LEHVWDDATYTQSSCGFSPQRSRVVALAQFPPAARQAGAGLHVHAPEPGLPVQVSCWPQLIAEPGCSMRQPLASFAHVTCSVVLRQAVPATVQAGTGVHVHAAEPGLPVHAWSDPHVFTPVTVRQPFPSALHVSTVKPLTQIGPFATHAESLLHVHWAEPALPVQIWWGPQADGAPYA